MYKRIKRIMTANIAINGIIAALYIVLTLVNPLSFGIINVRIADLIPIIAVIDSKKRIGVTIGMVTANLFSPFGLADAVVAVLICLCSFYGVPAHIDNEKERTLMLSIFTAFFVSIEISLFTGIPFLVELLIMLATQIPICFIGASIYHRIEREFKNV